MYQGIKKALYIAAVLLGAWIGIRLLLPLAFPFLLGGALALGAEPMVGFLNRRLKLRRGAAVGIGVSAAFGLLVLLVLLLCALILREIGMLVGILPNLEESLSGGLSALSAWALRLAARLPSGLRELLEGQILEFFSGSSRFLEETVRFLLGFTGGVLSQVPGSALVLGTAIISSYMISARLPGIRDHLRRKIPREKLQKILGGLRSLKEALLGWVKAQLKLMGLTWLILTMGLILLRIPYAPLWAAAVALVDAFPVLGTGTVLLPWALVSFLQGAGVRGVGLLSIYAVISLTRSVMEPKLLGSHLGLDPLVTLGAIYGGFKVWGFGGMLLAPVLAVAASQLLRGTEGPS